MNLKQYALWVMVGGLGLLNFAVWGKVPMESTLTPRPCGGCQQDFATGPPTIAEIDNSIQFGAGLMEDDPGELLPTHPCSGCTSMGTIKQSWCQLRPPGTDCSAIPWNDNFFYIRNLYFYDCGDGVIALCCTPWTYDSCCNNSSNAPKCQGGGATHNCSEASCPPL